MISKNNTVYNSLQLLSYLLPHWRNFSRIFTGCNKNTTFLQSFHWKLLGQAHALTLQWNTYMKLLSRMNTLVPLNLQCCYCSTSINLRLRHLPTTQVTSEKKINCIFPPNTPGITIFQGYEQWCSYFEDWKSVRWEIWLSCITKSQLLKGNWCLSSHFSFFGLI